MRQKQIDPLSFWKRYKLVGSSSQSINMSGQIRACRYCKASFPETTFNKTAHLIPELLGKNNTVCYDECDSCNEHFSKYESHLSKYFLPYLTMVGVEGKRGIPQFQSRTKDRQESTRTLVRHENGQRKLLVGDNEDYVVDHKNNTMLVRFRKPPHSPFLVYKALSKIGISLIDKDDLGKFSPVIEWLLNNEDKDISTFVFGFKTVLTGKMFSKPSVELYRAARINYAKSFVPEYTLVLKFANIVVQIYLPLPNTPAHKKPLCEAFPAFAIDGIQGKKYLSLTIIELSEKKNIPMDEELRFSFQQGEFGVNG